MRCTGLIRKSWNRNREFGVEGHVEDEDDELSYVGVTFPGLCFTVPKPDALNTAARESYECLRTLEGKSGACDVGDAYDLNAEGMRDNVRGGTVLLIGRREGAVVVVVDAGAL